MELLLQKTNRYLGTDRKKAACIYYFSIQAESYCRQPAVIFLICGGWSERCNEKFGWLMRLCLRCPLPCISKVDKQGIQADRLVCLPKRLANSQFLPNLGT